MSDPATPEGRASLLYQMFIVATEQQPEPYRSGLRKLAQKIGQARFEAGREAESGNLERRELELAQREFQIRVRERALA